MSKLTLEEHRKRHKEFHRILDEMVADFILMQSKENKPHLPSKVTLKYFMKWSCKQTGG